VRAAVAAHDFQNSESWAASPFDGNQGFGSSATFGTSIASEAVDSSMSKDPATVLTFVSALHYAESEAMTSTAVAPREEFSRRTVERGVQLKLF
jgi:hypothetical protein